MPPSVAPVLIFPEEEITDKRETDAPSPDHHEGLNLLDNSELLKRIESYYEKQRGNSPNKKNDLCRRYRTIALYLRKLNLYCISLPEVSQWSDALLESLLPQSGKVVAGANRPWYKYTAQWIKETEENVWAMDHISNYYSY